MRTVVLPRFRSDRSPARTRVLLAVCACSLALAACGSSHKSGTGTTTSTVRPLAVKTADLKSGTTDNETAGPLVGINNATGAKVLSEAQKYLDAAVFSPLSTGRIGAGYAALFDAGVRAGATGADARALTDAVVGKVYGYSETATPVAFTGLFDMTGAELYIATNFDVHVKATTDSGQLRIDHKVELTFAPGPAQTWTVTAYRVHTTRTSATAVTSTTAQSVVSKP